MDAYQQPHRYMRPPPAAPQSTSDPHQPYQQQQQLPARPPVPPPPGPSWYSNHFQYPHHSPSPPPPPHHHWAPPPPPDHLPQSHSSAYPPPPPLPYPPHSQQPPPFHANTATNNAQFPPPPRPPLPPHSQLPQPYPQEWGNPNWGHHPGWEYPAQNNVEDWGARAREWAAAKAASEDQCPQSQFRPVSRPEEQNRVHDQYMQSFDPHYVDIPQQSLPASGYQQFPIPAAPQHRQPIVYPQDSTPVSSGSPYVPDGHISYSVGDGSLAGGSRAGFCHQESLPTTSIVHQQEVPSSYSSIPGKEEIANQKEQSYNSLPLPISSDQDGQHPNQPSLPGARRSVLVEPSYMYGNHAADTTSNLSNQPLDFAPRYNSDCDPHMQSNYAAHNESMGTIRGIDPVASVPSINSWTPAPGVVYPPIPSTIPSVPQHDSSIALPPSVSGHAAPPFGRFPGQSFQPTIPSTGAPFGLTGGPAIHPTTAFPGDSYGVSSVSDRPKKASVPNWLKEEIIKNKAAITKSSLEHSREQTQSIDDEGVDKSFTKGDQGDSKSIDSSRSTEEEDDDDDDDEDYVEAARTAAINHEIKRILTEVLLKVTDELFDEIAIKVLSEDDKMVEGDHNAVASNHTASFPPTNVPSHKAAANISGPLVPKESETEGATEKSSSTSPGDVLGLANYASDDDDDAADDGDGEIQSSTITNSKDNAPLQLARFDKILEHAADNGGLKSEIEHGRDLDADLTQKSVPEPIGEKSSDHVSSSKLAFGDKDDRVNGDSGKVLDRNNGPGLNDTIKDKHTMKAELSGRSVGGEKPTIEDSQGKETKVKLDKNDQHESRKSSRRDFRKEVDLSRSRADENHRKQDERLLRKEKTDDRNGSKERMKGEGKPGEKAKESESRKKATHLDFKEDEKLIGRVRKTGSTKDADRKREGTKELSRSRNKVTSDSDRHKRRRSSSISSRGRTSKDNSVSHATGSSDEASDDSKRKPYSRKRNLSPSPIRRRQVSRSPHSKHSQRRHSPYSSLETNRERRSRSRSPHRRR